MKLQLVHWYKPKKGIKADSKCESCGLKQTVVHQTIDYLDMVRELFRTPCPDCGHQTIGGKK
jgi:hypothetical protein